MQRLGRNHGGYHGERIDVDITLRACRQAAQFHGWKVEELREGDGPELLAFTRPAEVPLSAHSAPRIYLSSGIHGDEPAALLAVQRLLERDRLPHQVSWTVCPCLNPVGCRLGTRENAAGRDLNRDYRHLISPEIRAHVAWLARQPAFDLSLCLHEDWESKGFYLYELNPEGRPSLAESMVEAAARVCPLDLSEEIEGRPARGGIIRPSLDPATRPEWPEAFYLLQNKTRLSYTLEAPSDYPMSARVDALVAAVDAATALGAGLSDDRKISLARG